jgi:Ca-activated chloride channel family protein
MRLIPALLVTSAILAQDTPTIKVDADVVNIAFTARDTHGRPVTDLTRDEIEVLEDGVIQPIRFFGSPSDLPLRLALILDGAYNQELFNFEHRNDLASFAERTLTGRDQALLVLFANRIVFATPFVSSPRALVNGFDAVDSDNHSIWARDRTAFGLRREGRALFDAVYDTARKKMMEPGFRKALIVFSNGDDTASAHDLIEAVEAAQAADSLIYAFHYTTRAPLPPNTRDRYGRMEMFRLADETGGLAYDSARVPVAKALAEISGQLGSLYDLGYATGKPVRDGTYRRIELRCKRPDIVVRSRHGYHAR